MWVGNQQCVPLYRALLNRAVPNLASPFRFTVRNVTFNNAQTGELQTSVRLASD